MFAKILKRKDNQIDSKLNSQTRTRQLNRSQVFQGLCFAVCFFAFMLSEAFVNKRAGDFYGPQNVSLAYGLGLMATGLGFVSYGIIRRLLNDEKKRKYITISIGILCLLSSAVFLVTEYAIIFICFGGLCLLTQGNLGATIYYYHGMSLENTNYIGRITGIGMAIATAFQIVLQNLFISHIVFLGSIVLSVVFVLYWIIMSPKDWILENPLPYSSNIQRQPIYEILAPIAVLLMSLIFSMVDSVITVFNAMGTFDIYGSVRLYYVFGLLAAGFIVDFKGGILLPIVTMCSVLLTSVSTTLLSNEGGYYISVALLYLCSGFYVMYFTYTFCNFAPRSKWPEFWAGLGRAIRCFTVGIFLLPIELLYNAFGSQALTLGSCILSAILLLIMMPQIIQTFRTDDDKANEKSQSPKDMVKAYGSAYNLTPREDEVLEKLILETDLSVQEIADKLFISRRVLQRYIASIYEKTGTKSRIDLYQDYVDKTIEKR